MAVLGRYAAPSLALRATGLSKIGAFKMLEQGIVELVGRQSVKVVVCGRGDPPRAFHRMTDRTAPDQIRTV